jgi:hypothetical protein
MRIIKILAIIIFSSYTAFSQLSSQKQITILKKLSNYEKVDSVYSPIYGNFGNAKNLSIFVATYNLGDYYRESVILYNHNIGKFKTISYNKFKKVEKVDIKYKLEDYDKDNENELIIKKETSNNHKTTSSIICYDCLQQNDTLSFQKSLVSNTEVKKEKTNISNIGTVEACIKFAKEEIVRTNKIDSIINTYKHKSSKSILDKQFYLFETAKLKMWKCNKVYNEKLDELNNKIKMDSSYNNKNIREYDYPLIKDQLISNQKHWETYMKSLDKLLLSKSGFSNNISKYLQKLNLKIENRIGELKNN